MLLRGSRNLEHRQSFSTSALDGPEIYGPPVAIPFKWEEVPGKPKPREEPEPTVLQMEEDHDFYNRLLTKERGIGESSRRPPVGNVPFDWEAQPGKPKPGAAIEETLAPLSPPPCLQPNMTPPHYQSPRGSFSQKVKSILHAKFSIPSSPKLQFNGNNDQAQSSQCSNSVDTDESGSCNSVGCSDGNFEFKDEAKMASRQLAIIRPPRKDAKERTGERREEEGPEESEFQDAVADFATDLENSQVDSNGSACNSGDSKETVNADHRRLTCEADDGIVLDQKHPNSDPDTETMADAVIAWTRLAQNYHKDKLKSPRHIQTCKTNAGLHRCYFTACLPMCSFAHRRPKVYEEYNSDSD